MRLPLDPSPMTVTTQKGRTEIKVEVARTSEERSRGLMFREKLAEGHGMLFVFEEPDMQSFWMKDTPEALDIIYIASDGKTVSIHKAEPLSTDPVPSGGPAQFVLELAYGEANRIGLMPGDRFEHPIIEAASK
ncbi:MAG: DUF192 domain-containing protein [Rhizobiaceae bacterium]